MGDAIASIHGGLNGLDTSKFDMRENARYVRIPLHHFCCHTTEEKEKIEHAVSSFGWSPVDVELEGGLCTTSGSESGDIPGIGIHFGVSKKSHEALVTLTRLIRHFRVPGKSRYRPTGISNGKRHRAHGEVWGHRAFQCAVDQCRRGHCELQ